MQPFCFDSVTAVLNSQYFKYVISLDNNSHTLLLKQRYASQLTYGVHCSGNVIGTVGSDDEFCYDESETKYISVTYDVM